MRPEDEEFFHVLTQAERQYHAALKDLATAHRLMQASGRDADSWRDVREAEARLDAASAALERAARRP